MAIANDPGNSVNYRGRGTAYARMGQPHHALADFSTAIQLDPSDAANYRERGTAYGQLGQIDSAIADLDVAILWDKNDADAYYRRAMLHILMGDRENAKNDLLDVLRIDPEHVEARYQFGLIREGPAPPARERREGVVKFVWGRLPRGPGDVSSTPFYLYWRCFSFSAYAPTQMTKERIQERKRAQISVTWKRSYTCWSSSITSEA